MQKKIIICGPQGCGKTFLAQLFIDISDKYLINTTGSLFNKISDDHKSIKENKLIVIDDCSVADIIETDKIINFLDLYLSSDLDSDYSVFQNSSFILISQQYLKLDGWHTINLK